MRFFEAQAFVAHRYELRALGRGLRAEAESKRELEARAGAEELEEDAERWAANLAAEKARWEAKLAEAKADVALAHRAAEVSKEEAVELAADLAAADAKKCETEWLLFLAEKREARAKSGLFGQGGSCRTKSASAGGKFEHLLLAGPSYEARRDTCIKAYVRHMAASIAGI